MIFQFKRFLSLLLVILVLISAVSVPAYAADEVYTVSDDASALSAPVFYTPDYYPGAVAEMRSSRLYSISIAHGSYSELNYNPSWLYKSGSSYPSGDFNALTPSVTADQTDVSGIYYIPNTTFLSGSLLTFRLPCTDDCYFDFQSSNFLFDQQSPQANTFYINGDLTFSLRNLWAFNGSNSDGVALTDSWYLASDPLAVQLVIDGKAYGDIIDVTSYTSPFTALYNGGVPSNATVTFDNLKVYYQGDTPDMIGFRVYTGCAFTDGQYHYNNAGQFIAVDVTNTVTFRCSEIPDITFVQEGGDGYAGDLSGISGLLNQILSGISGLRSLMVDNSGTSVLSLTVDNLASIYSLMVSNSGTSLLSLTVDNLASIYYQLVDSSGSSYLANIFSRLTDIFGRLYLSTGSAFLRSDGSVARVDSSLGISSLGITHVLSNGLIGLSQNIKAIKGYFSDTVFPWQSYNMETHQLNAATNITGQNNLFFTAFQSMEDKLGRLAYVFGSDEDLALKDDADPGTDAFRENFGGGASLSQISDGADVVEGIDGLFDSGYDFGDAFTEISGESMFAMWFSAENAAAVDSTGSVMALDDSDPYNMQIYYDRLQEVAEKRDWGSD